MKNQEDLLHATLVAFLSDILICYLLKNYTLHLSTLDYSDSHRLSQLPAEVEVAGLPVPWSFHLLTWPLHHYYVVWLREEKQAYFLNIGTFLLVGIESETLVKEDVDGVEGQTVEVAESFKPVDFHNQMEFLHFLQLPPYNNQLRETPSLISGFFNSFEISPLCGNQWPQVGSLVSKGRRFHVSMGLK
ncbi:unnamed protein product [Fraxinus pennsylvanica]|uniref:Uncharacterized protein n=1 Tax=Fraxinus pennsylvanica TaxID=56036 RepID=A0AAD2ADB7_9LAMI|nr:unnamed protein product [Fraxinus pennsylvanica]